MVATASGRTAPNPDQYVPSTPFWDGVRDGHLVLQVCLSTGRFQHFPRPVDLQTGRRDLGWREVSGRGVVYAVTVIRTPVPGFPAQTQLVVANVELSEGVRILGRILNRAPGEVAIGDRVALAWDRLDDGTRYPAFEVD